jgi:iron complex outermembrane receptor protein
VQGVPGVNYSGGQTSNNVFNTFTGATTTDPHGGIAPFTTFSIDMSYKLPTPELPVIKYVLFDLNAQNIFNRTYWQYYYKQVSPAACSVTATNPTGNPYGCGKEFADGIPGQPASVFFTVTARF